jgi:hypothetical protein
VLYLWQANVYLIDPAVHTWSTYAAGWTALAFMLGFWLVYDTLCKTLGQRAHGERWLALVLLVLVAALCWLFNQLYAGRAAFVLMGATLATSMSANVFFCIIPGQRIVVDALTRGQPYDEKALAVYGQRGKQRSVHNTYFTLPVLFAMLASDMSRRRTRARSPREPPRFRRTMSFSPQTCRMILGVRASAPNSRREKRASLHARYLRLSGSSRVNTAVRLEITTKSSRRY